MSNVERIVESFNDGELSRRTAFRSLLRAGLAGPAAALYVGSASSQTDQTSAARSRELLSAALGNLYKLVDDPEFASDVAAVAAKSSREAKRKSADQFISKWSSQPALKQRGHDPAGTKMAYRVFEVPKTASELLLGGSTLSADEFVFVPNDQVKAAAKLIPPNSSTDGITTRVSVTKAKALAGRAPLVQGPQTGSPGTVKTQGWSVCVSSGPGGIICGSIGYFQ